MKKKMGIWIDHEKAYCVSIAGDKESREKIKSHIDRLVRLSGGSRSRTPFGPQEVASEKKADEKCNTKSRGTVKILFRFLKIPTRFLSLGRARRSTN